jgi:hypothetical protein
LGRSKGLDFIKTNPPEDQRIELVLQNLHLLQNLTPLVEDMKFTPDAHVNSKALVRLFARPWYNRVWVIQEVNANVNVIVQCGNTEISWDGMGLISSYIGIHIRVSDPLHDLYRSCNHGTVTFLRYRAALHEWPLYQLQVHTSRWNATDPRDHIYANLGLPGFAKSGVSIVPAYDEPVKQVYCDFAMLCLHATGNLNFLSFAGTSREDPRPNYASWIPRWDQKRWTRLLVGDTTPPWTASDGSLPEIASKAFEDFLWVKGAKLDSIERVFSIDPSSWRWQGRKPESNPLYHFQQAEDPERQCSYPHTDDSLLLAYSAVLVNGQDPQGKRITDTWGVFAMRANTIIRFFDLHKATPDQVMTNEYAQAWDGFQRMACLACDGRIPFSTSFGYLGLGPEMLQSGDVVCVLYGATVPYILRPQNGHYILIGEAYVHGAMLGEAMEKLQQGQLIEEEFEIH